MMAECGVATSSGQWWRTTPLPVAGGRGAWRVARDAAQQQQLQQQQRSSS
jgi:hypothetical protein